MSDKLAVIVQESGIEKTKAQYVLEQFQDFANQAADWEQKTRALVITDASQTAEMALAKSARLNLRDIRVAAEKKKKELKAGILVEGRLIDAMYNFIAGVTEPIEAELLEKEKFVERQEAARIAALKAKREEQLEPYGIDTQYYSLGVMSEGAFSNLLGMSRTAHEAKQAAAQKLEEERIAREKKEADEKAERERLDREERAKQAAENDRLKKEAEELASKRAKEEKKRKEEDRKRQAELDQAKRALQDEMDRAETAVRAEKEKAEAEIRKANEAAERALRELQAKKDDEDKQAFMRKCQEEARKQMMESASDSEKLKIYITELQSVVTPDLITGEAKRQLTIIRVCLEKSIEFAEKIK